jgi:1-acyl-sn-glycerol-3-phosphate acyltransferase
MKRTTDDKYKLIWANRVGFAKAAIKNKAIIIPVANIGTEDFLDVVYDVPLSAVPIPFLFGSDRTFPVFVPNINEIQKVYFKFGSPIDTASLSGDTSEENCLRIRDLVKNGLESEIEYLKVYRQSDEKRLLASEMKTNLKKIMHWISTRKGSNIKSNL